MIRVVCSRCCVASHFLIVGTAKPDEFICTQCVAKIEQDRIKALFEKHLDVEDLPDGTVNVTFNDPEAESEL